MSKHTKPRLNVSKRHRAQRARVQEVDLRPRSEIVAERQQRKKAADGPSLEALAGVAIAAPVGYLTIEGLMPGNRHPIHWIVTAIVGAVGYVIGQGVYRWRESH